MQFSDSIDFKTADERLIVHLSFKPIYMRQSYMQLCTSVSINKESINKEKYKQRNNKKYKATFIIKY